MSYTRIIPPDECPSCGHSLEKVNDQYFCTNKATCPAQQSGKLINFCKKLKIKGFGQATLDKLELSSIDDLLELTPKYGVSKGLSEHMAVKLTNVVKERLSQGINYQEFLAAMSIPLVGDSASSKLELESLDDLSFELCKKQGLGDKVSENLQLWVTSEWQLLKPTWSTFIKYKKKQQPVGTTQLNKTVVITGKLTDFKNRAEATKHLESLGFTVKTSVTKTTDYLVCEDGTTGSSYQKALTLNKPIVTIKTLEEKYVKN
jgi:NAD-dependent DNA ligase